MRKINLLAFFMSFLTIISAAGYLSGPESAVYDTTNKVTFISNWKTGRIVKMKSDGAMGYYSTGHGSCMGNWIYNERLYVSCSSYKVKSISLSDSTDIITYDIPDAGYLDGITVDNQNNLYVAWYHPTIPSRIYKIDLSAKEDAVPFITSGLPTLVQDMIFDEENNRLVIVSASANAPIQSYSFSTEELTTITPSAGHWDGIIRDKKGNYYLSQWANGEASQGCIYIYDKDFAEEPRIINGDYIGPAGLAYNPDENLLIIPSAEGDKIDFLDLLLSIKPSNPFSIHTNNYPNPFNPNTTISYNLTESGNVKIEIYNSLGKKIRTLLNREESAGKDKQILWNGKDDYGKSVSSGVYLYKIETENQSVLKKILLVK